MGHNPSTTLFDEVIADLPTLCEIASRFGLPPTMVLRRRMIAGLTAAAIAAELQCTVEQVQRWVAIIKSRPSIAHEPAEETPVKTEIKPDPSTSETRLQPVSEEYPAKKRRRKSSDRVKMVRDQFGERDVAIIVFSAADSISALLRDSGMDMSYFVFRAALRAAYGDNILEEFGKKSPAPVSAKPVKPNRIDVLNHTSRGEVITAIVNAFNRTKTWAEAANMLGVKLEKLREIIKEKPSDFSGSITSQDLSLLLNLESDFKMPPAKFPPQEEGAADMPLQLGQVRHPCDVILSKDSVTELANYLESQGVDEEEFFTSFYDETMALEVSAAVGLSTEVLDKLADYYQKRAKNASEQQTENAIY